MPFSTFPLVQVGLAVFASVYTVAQAVLGSLLVAGNVYLDTSNNVTPSVCVNSGCVMTWAGTDGVRGGGKRITASGSFMKAEVPVPVIYASGAYLNKFSIECDKTPTLMSGAVTLHQFTKQGTYAGTVLRQDIKTATGSATLANSGLVVSTKLTAGYYVSFTGSGGKTAAFTLTGQDCIFRPEFRSKYGR